MEFDSYLRETDHYDLACEYLVILLYVCLKKNYKHILKTRFVVRSLKNFRYSSRLSFVFRRGFFFRLGYHNIRYRRKC